MDIQDKIEEYESDGLPIGKGWIAAGIAAVFVLYLLSSIFFQVGTDSVGIVLRFGEPVREVGPGLHFKLPIGVEDVRYVPTQRQQKEEFGYRTARPGVDTKYEKGDYSKESLMLTGDLNVVDVQWAVQYRISEPEKYLFNVRDARDTFRYMSQAVMREVIGDRTVNEVLTIGRSELTTAAEEKLRALCDEYEIGMRVEQINLQNVTPPDPVKPSFNAVNAAQQKRSQLINEAKADYNKAIPNAEGEAKRKIQQAEGYATQRVNRAQGEVARFESVYAEYKAAPEVTERRLFIESLREVLPKVERKVVVDENASDVVPLLSMGDGPLDALNDNSTSGQQ